MHDQNSSGSNQLARPALVVAVASSSLFMEMLDSTVILTALPRMALDFHTTAVGMGIGLTTYLLALAAVLPASGWLADRFGTRRVFLSAVVGFLLSSILCGVCQSLWQFVVARSLQGAAAALMSPVARLSMVKTLQGERLARAINMGAMAALLGPTIGPPLGGFIATYSSWRWIFFINVPIGIVGFLLARRALPDYRSTQPRPFDGRGLMLNALALMALLYGLDGLGRSGASPTLQWSLIGAGLMLGWAALQHARQHRDSVLELVAMRVTTFRAALFGGAVYRIGLFAPIFMLPLLLQLALGMTPFAAGLLLFVGAAADVMAKMFVIRTLRRFGFRTLLMATALLYAAFPLALVWVNAATPLPLLILLLVYGGAARSFQMSLSNALIYTGLQREQVSGASTLAAVSQQVAMALAVASAALLFSIGTKWSGGDSAAVRPADFRLGFVFSAAVSCCALIWYSRLARSAGAEVSGHRA
jgi:EmrB/QacA subfamily drug resistance transporter